MQHYPDCISSTFNQHRDALRAYSRAICINSYISELWIIPAVSMRAQTRNCVTRRNARDPRHNLSCKCESQMSNLEDTRHLISDMSHLIQLIRASGNDRNHTRETARSFCKTDKRVKTDSSLRDITTEGRLTPSSQ